MIRVLVIDDSAVMRAFLSRVVASQPDMELVGASPDPLLAIDRIRRQPPDVITLDVEMPRMNGLDFLRNLMAMRPLPVIMISSLTRQGAETTMRALELGAVDFFPKPASFDQLESGAQEIADKIRAAAGARVVRHRRAPVPPSGFAPLAPRALTGPAAQHRVIGIGASTGGVEALRDVLTGLSATMPPILIAQHMPPGFTETFARRLDALCEMDVKQAEDAEVVRTGVAYIAPGGRHLMLVRRGMPNTTQVASSCAMVRAPVRRSSTIASAPSAPMPVSITPIAWPPAARAIERNSVSTEGRCRFTGGSSVTRSW